MSEAPDLHITPVAAFADNYLWLIHDDRHAAVVDPGDATAVLAALKRMGLNLDAIVLTHHHRDHIGGVDELLAAYPGIPVYGPRNEAIPGITEKLGQGDQIVVAALGLALRIIDVPGHTAGHIAYFGQTRAGPVLFCGDTLFASGCGKLFEGTPAQMHGSLSKLAALPAETKAYCAHEYTLSNIAFARAVEPNNAHLREWADTAQAERAAGRPTVPTTIGHEKRCNPFLRSHTAAVQSAAAAHAPGSATDPITTFAVIRDWKNNFRA